MGNFVTDWLKNQGEWGKQLSNVDLMNPLSFGNINPVNALKTDAQNFLNPSKSPSAYDLEEAQLPDRSTALAEFGKMTAEDFKDDPYGYDYWKAIADNPELDRHGAASLMDAVAQLRTTNQTRAAAREQGSTLKEQMGPIESFFKMLEEKSSADMLGPAERMMFMNSQNAQMSAAGEQTKKALRSNVAARGFAGGDAMAESLIDQATRNSIINFGGTAPFELAKLNEDLKSPYVSAFSAMSPFMLDAASKIATLEKGNMTDPLSLEPYMTGMSDVANFKMNRQDSLNALGTQNMNTVLQALLQTGGLATEALPTVATGLFPGRFGAKTKSPKSSPFGTLGMTLGSSLAGGFGGGLGGGYASALLR